MPQVLLLAVASWLTGGAVVAAVGSRVGTRVTVVASWLTGGVVVASRVGARVVAVVVVSIPEAV